MNYKLTISATCIDDNQQVLTTVSIEREITSETPIESVMDLHDLAANYLTGEQEIADRPDSSLDLNEPLS